MSRKAKKSLSGKKPASPADRPASQAVYTDEQFEWLKACEAYRLRTRRNFMKACDYLEVARELYRLERKGPADERT